MKKGFTLVELLLVMGIFAIIATLTSINFYSTYAQSNLGSAHDVLISDLKTAQSSAMSGLGDTTWSTSTMTPLPSGVTLTTTFPSGQVSFLHGSGEIQGYSSGQDTITLSSGTETKIIRLNQYGTIINE